MSAKRKHPWYSEEAEFFGKGYLKEYKDIVTDEKAKKEVDFVVRALKLKPGMKILDLACGHGRHAIELAKRGYKVTGLDLNGHFLEEAKKSALKAKKNIRWIKSDMRVIPFTGEFDVVLNLFTSFGYLENDEEDQKVFAAVMKALKPKGTFLLNIRSLHQLMAIYKKEDILKLPDGSRVVATHHFNTTLGRNEEKRIRIGKDGKRKVFEVLCRMYTTPELIKMGKEEGLKFIQAYGEDGKEHTIDSKRLIVVFRKS